MPPSDAVLPGTRPTSMPSFIRSIQPFGHNTPRLQTDRQTDRTDRQDNGPIAQGEPFYKRSSKISLLSSCLQVEYVGCWHSDCKGGEENEIETGEEADVEDAQGKDINRKIDNGKRRDKEA